MPVTQVGSARPAGHEHGPHLPGGLGVALGGMRPALLMADEDVLEGGLEPRHRVVDMDHRATRMAEDHLDAFCIKGTYKNLSAGHKPFGLGQHRLPFGGTVALGGGIVCRRRFRCHGGRYVGGVDEARAGRTSLRISEFGRPSGDAADRRHGAASGARRWSAPGALR